MSSLLLWRGLFTLIVFSISLICIYSTQVQDNFNTMDVDITEVHRQLRQDQLRVPHISELCRSPTMDDELHEYHRKIPTYSYPGLPRLLDAEQRKMNMEFLLSIKRLFCDVNATWTLYFGSLLGAYISHDVIAWDDDLDIILDDNDMKPIIEMHKNGTLGPKYDIGYVNVTGLHKLYWTRSKILSPWWWSWPFVDVIPFKRVGSKIRLIDREKAHSIYLDKNYMFPLHLRPFGGAWLPVPRDPWKMMKLTYYREIRKFKCLEPGYDHVREIVRKNKRSVDCNSLEGYYPFAYRSANGTTITESLKIADRVIYTWEPNEPFYSGTQPFDWRLI